MNTLDGLERHEGHLPELVRHPEPGAAPAAVRLDRRQRQPGRGPHALAAGLRRARADAATRHPAHGRHRRHARAPAKQPRNASRSGHRGETIRTRLAPVLREVEALEVDRAAVRTRGAAVGDRLAQALEAESLGGGPIPRAGTPPSGGMRSSASSGPRREQPGGSGSGGGTPWRSAPRRWPTAWTSGSCTTGTAASSRSATGSPTRRAPDASTPRTTTCSRRRLGSRASSPSPRATCRQEHWFQLGRALVGVDGVPTLVSWSGSMFEYLMPLLVMRSYPDTLLDQTCRRGRGADRVRPAARRSVGDLRVGVQPDGPARQLPVQGLRRSRAGLKRGLAEDLVVAPYATALAAMVDPARRRRICSVSRARAPRALRLLRGARLHPREVEKDEKAASPAAKEWRSRPTSRTTRGCRWWRSRTRCCTTPWWRASTRGPRAGDRAVAAGARAPVRPGHASEADRDDAPGASRAAHLAAPLPHAAHPPIRTPRSCRTGTTSRS